MLSSVEERVFSAALQQILSLLFIKKVKKKKKNLVLIVKHLNRIKISVINAPFLFTVSAGER